MDNQTEYTKGEYATCELRNKWRTMSINELKEIFELPEYKEEVERKGFYFEPFGTEEHYRREKILKEISYIKYLIKFKKEPIEVRQSRRIRGKETNIYLMIDHACDLYKIGRSKNVIQREKTLGAQIPKIECLYSFEGHVEDEKELHAHFHSKRGRGEWFDLSDDDIDFIKNFIHFKKQREYEEDSLPQSWRCWRARYYTV